MSDLKSSAAPQQPADVNADQRQQAEALQARLRETRKRLRRMRGIRAIVLVLSIITLLFSFLYAGQMLWPRDSEEWREHFSLALSVAVWALIFGAIAAVLPVRSIEFELQELEDELDLSQMGSESHEQKAHKLLKIQQNQLTRYLTVILAQSRSIFVVGVFAMLVGLAVVIFAIWQTKNATNETEKVIVGILGAVGAILTNFVAAIYLRMFGETGQAVQRSMGSLTQSANLNFAHVLISKIDDRDLRRGAYKELAMKIAESRSSA
jgi:hypothetical protein